MTAAAWHTVVTAMIQEGTLALAANGHFTTSVLDIINELYALDEATFSNIRNELFPTGAPSPHSSVTAQIFNLFIEAAEAMVIAIGPEGLPVNAGLHVLGAVIGGVEALPAPDTPANTFDTIVEQVATHINDMASDAMVSNDALLGYVVGDPGLLALFGTLVDDGIWQIDSPQHDAAVSAGRLSLARWVYQTMLPLRWSVVQCARSADPSNPGTDWPCPDLDEDTIELYTAYNRSMGKDLTWYAYLSDDAGGGGLVPKISEDDPTFEKVFTPVELSSSSDPLPCQFPWSFADCTAGMSIADALTSANGWNLPCTVSNRDFSIGCNADLPG